MLRACNTPQRYKRRRAAHPLAQRNPSPVCLLPPIMMTIVTATPPPPVAAIGGVGLQGDFVGDDGADGNPPPLAHKRYLFIVVIRMPLWRSFLS